jgi:hypothetical protein
MNNTSGFYKNESGLLLFAPNGVISFGYDLQRETRSQQAYPVDGWYWFDTEAEARTFFGLSDTINNTTTTPTVAP